MLAINNEPAAQPIYGYYMDTTYSCMSYSAVAVYGLKENVLPVKGSELSEHNVPLHHRKIWFKKEIGVNDDMTTATYFTF